MALHDFPSQWQGLRAHGLAGLARPTHRSPPSVGAAAAPELVTQPESFHSLDAEQRWEKKVKPEAYSNYIYLEQDVLDLSVGMCLAVKVLWSSFHSESYFSNGSWIVGWVNNRLWSSTIHCDCDLHVISLKLFEAQPPSTWFEVQRFCGPPAQYGWITRCPKMLLTGPLFQSSNNLTRVINLGWWSKATLRHASATAGVFWPSGTAISTAVFLPRQ